ncbi:HpcH/HpaI aldolase/citrate lyase family protein [Verminephrobacter eiseniae]|uniref:HpcH/HpaI aldolase n=2 Tax=Verminephrobacter eiseniae TaxID=364317 RepID=A1WS86_VEREI|nr:CoA ester lyase [Verminephrobacter eiseniae]ABM60493.1 HpcH/HpaI aldolase [Verminephrobacter eiseniae EF01-2]
MTHAGMAPTGPAPALAEARSFLFVPANRPDRLPKALASGADAVIIDLEDAIAPPQRDGARSALQPVWASIAAPDRARLVLRINGAGTPWHRADVALARALVADGLAALMLAKAEQARDLAALAQACPGAALLPLVESAEGAAALDALAAAPRVLRLALGDIDLQADLGMACGPEQAELAPLRWAMVLASRRAALAPPIDGVTTARDDAAALTQDTARSRRFGFAAKLCIHPAQIAVVHAAFAPGARECDWARRVLAAAEAAGGGVCVVDGRMVDAPVIALARQTLRRQA